VTRIQKALFFLFFLFFHFVQAQDKTPLREYITAIEEKFPYNFAFVDVDLASHYVIQTPLESIDAALAFLRNQTLFNYTTLQDQTITIQKKENLLLVCGVVLSAEKNTPLSNGAIVTPYQQIVSAADGTFELRTAASTDVINIQYAGQETLSYTASELVKTPCQELLLFPKIEYLNTVTIANYFAKGISKNNDGSLKVNYADFDILPGLVEPDVLLTIQALPGIQSVNESVSFLNIRGGTNDQNLILWDGIKMYQNGHFFGLISAFNPFLTQEVTVFKNGSPAAYGDGVSGVISMEGGGVDPNFTVGAGVNLISADVFANIPLKDLGSFQVSARRSINTILETPTYNAYFDKAFQNTELTSGGGNILPSSDDSFSFFDLSLRSVMELSEKDFLRLNLLVLGNDFKFLENAEVDNRFQSLQSDLLQNNVSGGIFYKRQWSDQLSTDVQLYGSSYELEALNSDIINNQVLRQVNDVLESGIKLNGRYRFSEKVQASLGYQLNETGITNFEQINNPFFEITDKQVLLTNSLFAETNYRPLPNTTLNLGMRVNHINKFDEILWEPRISLNYRFLKYVTFEILGELKSQTTSQIVDVENDFLGVEKRRWVLSRPDGIPIVKGRQLSAGITVNRKGWLASAEPYIKKVDGITSQSQGFQNQFQNERTHGSYTTSGVDFLVNKRFQKINTWLSYSYAHNDYDFDTFTPSQFHNNIDIRHTLTYGLTYAIENFNISGGFNWHSGKPTTTLVVGNEIVDGNLNFDSPNAQNIDDYIRFDVSGTYDFKIGKKANAFVGVSVWNLLNTDNVVNHFFRLNDQNEIEEVDEFALGFTPNVSFRITF